MAGTPSETETAAIAAALQRFQAETGSPAGLGSVDRSNPWQRAALLESVRKRVTIEDLEGEGGARWLS